MRRMRRLSVVIGVAALATAALAGVAPLAQGSAPRQSSGAGGTLRVGADLSLGEIQFDLMKVQVVGTSYHNLVYGTLLKMTPSGEVVPDLAKSVDVVDPSTIKVVLRPGLKFTDGTPVDAAAYKFSIDRMINQALPGGKEAEVNQIASVTVDAPLEFTVALKTPIAGAITRLMRLCEVGCPQSPTAVQNGTDFSTNPVGAGPYKLKVNTPGQEFVLEKNPDYWDAKNIKVGTIQYKNVPGSATVTAITGNQTDFASFLSQLQTQEMAGSPNIKTKTITTDNSMLIGHMCKSRPPFDSLEVRQALNYASDRDDFNEKLFQGSGEDMWGWFKSSSPNFDPALDDYYAYNVKKAKKLLKAAGQENLTFDIGFTPGVVDSETGAQVAQQQWQKAGITTNLVPLTSQLDFFPDGTKVPMYFFALQRAGIPKVSRILVPGSFGDVCQWDDPELTALVTQAQGLADGSPEQAKVWHDINKRTLETAAVVFVLFGTQSYAYNSGTVQKIAINEGRTGIPELYVWGTSLKKS
jgi:peptide/nickel transport system substrate-binding protein